MKVFCETHRPLACRSYPSNWGKETCGLEVLLQRFEELIELLPRLGEPMLELRESVLAQDDLFDKVLFGATCRL